MQDNADTLRPPDAIQASVGSVVGDGKSNETSITGNQSDNKPNLMKNFFGVFGRGKGNIINSSSPLAQPDMPPVPQQASVDSFANRLDNIGAVTADPNTSNRVQANVEPGVMLGPNVIPNQEVATTQLSNSTLAETQAASGLESNVPLPESIGEIPVVSMQSSPVATPDVGTLPDLSNPLVADSLASTQLDQAMEGNNNEAGSVADPEVDDPKKTLLINTRASLVSMGDQARQMQEAINKNLKEIDDLMGSNLAGTPTDIPVELPKETVGVASS